jgi:hypothetical protein
VSRIKELEGLICTLKENKNKLSPHDPDASSIDQQLERYRKAVQNLEDEMFVQMNECFLLTLFQLFVLFAMIAN